MKSEKPVLGTMDWLIIIGMLVGGAASMIVYANTNFSTKEDKQDIKDDLVEIKQSVRELNSKVDNLILRKAEQ